MYFADYNSTTRIDCSQFTDDYNILINFPFSITINPTIWTYPMPTYAQMDDNNTYVQWLRLSEESHVPPSVFCLKNLERLTIFRTPFLNGKKTFI